MPGGIPPPGIPSKGIPPKNLQKKNEKKWKKEAQTEIISKLSKKRNIRSEREGGGHHYILLALMQTSAFAKERESRIFDLI